MPLVPYCLKQSVYAEEKSAGQGTSFPGSESSFCLITSVCMHRSCLGGSQLPSVVPKRCSVCNAPLWTPPAKRRGVQAGPAVAAVAASDTSAGKEVVVGIDLGTTNSAVAHMVDGQPVCIPNSLGDTLTPSVVSFQPDGTTLVGRAAKQAQSNNPSTTYYSVKRLIGRSWSDAVVQDEMRRLAYPVSWSDLVVAWDPAGVLHSSCWAAPQCCSNWRQAHS